MTGAARSRRRWLPILALAGVIASAPAHAGPPATRDYVVQAGDSCVSIATRELGDATQYTRIHDLNPGLGKLPHKLVPGSILKLPGAAPRPAPDATLSAARGAVRVRRPELEAWDPALVGMGLFRAWRVNAQARASAEVTFRDASRLVMRENTLVIILGATAPRAAIAHAEAVLESGGLESRLEAASRPSVVVRTPSSEARLGAGRSLVTVDPAGVSVVANHAGAPVAVRGVDARRAATGPSVAVAAGMGSRVVPRQRPSPPRALPPAPSWAAAPARFVDLAGAGASVAMRWEPVVGAARYRVEIVTPAGGELTSAEVPATITAFEAHQLPPGSYVAHVSTIDAERFESPRSLDRRFEVVAVAVIAPGARAPLAPPPAAADAPPELAAPPAPPAPVRLATGSRVVAPAGLACSLGDAAPRAELALARPGDAVLGCVADDGAPAAGVALTVAPVEVRGAIAGPTARASRTAPSHVRVVVASDAELGTDLIVRTSDELRVVSTTAADHALDVVVEATGRGGDRGTLVVAAGSVDLGSVDVAIEPRPEVAAAVAPRAPRAPRFELGAYAGYHAYRTGGDAGSELGGARDPERVVGPGPELGLRLGARLRPWLGLDGEAGFVAAGWAGTAGRAVVATLRLNAALTLAHGGRLGLDLIAGAGGDALVRASPGAPRDTAAVVDAGLRFGVRGDRGVRWWLEARDDLQPSRGGGPANVLGVRMGLARAF